MDTTKHEYEMDFDYKPIGNNETGRVEAWPPQYFFAAHDAEAHEHAVVYCAVHGLDLRRLMRLVPIIDHSRMAAKKEEPTNGE